MTYMHQGRQYIVFTAGNAATAPPAQLVAYALPPPPSATPANPAGQQ